MSEASKQFLAELCDSVGEDLTREGFAKTPERMRKAWGELLSGYKTDPDSFLTVFENEGMDQMVMLKDIPFYSVCEHHTLPFFGVAHVAYIPGQKIVGLSKLARVVDVYARRFQNQERLTQQIADLLNAKLSPLGVAVCLEGQHMCMLARGVQKQGAKMRTMSLKGSFLTEDRVRNEFLSAI